MILWQRVTLAPPANVGAPAQLPEDLFGLEDESLADLPLAIGTPAATELGYLNTGFLPVEIPEPPVTLPVSNGALRIALRRVGLLNDFNQAVNALPQEFKIWWDHTSMLDLAGPFVTAVVAEAGPPLSDDIEAVFVAAQTVQPA